MLATTHTQNRGGPRLQSINPHEDMQRNPTLTKELPKLKEMGSHEVLEGTPADCQANLHLGCAECTGFHREDLAQLCAPLSNEQHEDEFPYERPTGGGDNDVLDSCQCFQPCRDGGSTMSTRSAENQCCLAIIGEHCSSDHRHGVETVMRVSHGVDLIHVQMRGCLTTAQALPSSSPHNRVNTLTDADFNDASLCRMAISARPGGTALLLEACGRVKSLMFRLNHSRRLQQNSNTRDNETHLDNWRRELRECIESLMLQARKDHQSQAAQFGAEFACSTVPCFKATTSNDLYAQLTEEEEWFYLQHCLKQVVLDMVHADLWPLVLLQTLAKDAALSQGICNLLHHSAERFGLQPELELATRELVEASSLRMVAMMRTPIEMKQQLCDTLRRLTAATKALHTKALAADELLPLTSLLIIRSHPMLLVAATTYIDLFSHLEEGKHLSGEDAYILTNVMAAIEWVSQGAPLHP